MPSVRDDLRCTTLASDKLIKNESIDKTEGEKKRRYLWQAGRGRELWERSKAGGMNVNERHMRVTCAPHRSRMSPGGALEG